MGGGMIQQHDSSIAGRRVLLVGKLASMPRRNAERIIREHGGVPVDATGDDADIVVAGDEAGDLRRQGAEGEIISDVLRARISTGEVELIGESALWTRLGLVESGQGVERLYTPAMLAELVRAPIAAIRQWHRRGAIVAKREVQRLPYFDFKEVGVARKLAQLLDAGCSLANVNRKLESLGRLLPGIERPLADPAVVVEGRRLFIRREDGLAEPTGQLLIEFDAAKPPAMGEAGEVEDGPTTISMVRAEALHKPKARARARIRMQRMICGRWPQNSRGRGVRSRRWRRIGRCCFREIRRLRITSRWPSCCIWVATCRRRGSGITWRSSWTRTLSRPARTWAACSPNWANLAWLRLLFAGRSNIIRTTRTLIIIWRGFWIGRIGRPRPCVIGSCS